METSMRTADCPAHYCRHFSFFGLFSLFNIFNIFMGCITNPLISLK